MTLHDYLAVALVLLQIADIATTIKALRLPGTREANPFMAKLMDKIGRDRALVGLKLIFIALLLATYQVAPWQVLAGAVALYVFVVVKNILVIRRASR